MTIAVVGSTSKSCNWHCSGSGEQPLDEWPVGFVPASMNSAGMKQTE